jgi:hypothetical protein
MALGKSRVRLRVPSCWFVHTRNGREGEGDYDLTCLLQYARERQQEGEICLPTQSCDPRRTNMQVGDLLAIWSTEGLHSKSSEVLSNDEWHTSAVRATARVEVLRPAGSDPEPWEVMFAVPNADGTTPTNQSSYSGQPSYSYPSDEGRAVDESRSAVAFQMRETFYEIPLDRWSQFSAALTTFLDE